MQLWEQRDPRAAGLHMGVIPLRPQRETQDREFDHNFNNVAIPALGPRWCRARREGVRNPFSALAKPSPGKSLAQLSACRMCRVLIPRELGVSALAVRDCCMVSLPSHRFVGARCPLVSPPSQESCDLGHACSCGGSGTRHHPVSACRKHLLS